MSRRRGEFEHRTSLFEGAYRAWSHLGGLTPEDLFSKTVDELDPLNMSTEPSAAAAAIGISPVKPKAEEHNQGGEVNGDDSKVAGADSDSETAAATAESETNSKKTREAYAGTAAEVEGGSMDPDKRDWRYEPLPRSGLEHPYVRSIINPWLGSDCEDPDEVEQGLATLRNWWQHRRKGESRSAVNALGTDKMRGIVDGYTRHYFKLALELVKRDKAHPPKSLLSKMGGSKSERNRQRKPKRKKDHSEDEEEVGAIMTSLAGVRSLEGAGGRASLSAGLPVLGGLESLPAPGNAVPASAASALKDRSFSFLAGLGSTGGLPGDYSASTIEFLLQRQQQSAMDPLDLANLARSTHLMAATSVLTPLEQLHLLHRERQLALLCATYGTTLTAASLGLSQGTTGLTNYSPPSWLLEPVARKSPDASPEKSP